MKTLAKVNVEPDNIPQSLRERNQWVKWKTEIIDGEPRKTPYNPSGRTKAQSNNPATWGPFGKAMDGLARGGFDGVGFMFDDDDPFVGIDIDSCRDPETGKIDTWAQSIIEGFDTYAEVSPSQTGVKLFIRGKWPLPTGKNKKLPHLEHTAGKVPGIEAYGFKRYFATTGQRLPGCPAEPQERQTQLEALVAEHWPRTVHRNGHAGNGATTASTSVIERARRYVDKMPPAISGQNGSGATYAAACVLCIRFNLGRDDALMLLREYSTRCEPPWSEWELEHKIDNAMQAEGERGDLLKQSRDENPMRRNEQTIDGAFAEAAADDEPEWNSDEQSAPQEEPKAPPKQKRKREAKPIVVGNPTDTDLRTAAGRTDASNGRRFAQLYAKDVLWCDTWGKWYVWDSKRWAPDTECRTDVMAKNVSNAVWQLAASLLPDLDPGTGREVTSFARMTASARGIGNMLAMAKSETGIPVVPEKLDAHPWKFNCPNGTVNLKNGEILKHDRADRLTKLCPTEYLSGPEAECPLWEQTLERIFKGSSDLVGFFQRLLGCAMVGEVTEHILPIWHGNGSNGKSLTIETLLEVLGSDYAGKAVSEMLLASKGDRHPTERADLHGKRLVVAVETDDGRRLAEGLVKEVTGGDTIKCRRMREDYWSFIPSHMMVLVTNHKPIVRGTDHGLWRRLRLVPFEVQFWDADRGETGPPELQADKQLKAKLRAEYPGILRWLVDGCLQWQRHGLGEPPEVRDATTEYRTEMDVVGAFIADVATEATTCRIRSSELYKAYAEWCKQAGEHAVSQRRFGQAMSERGFERIKNNGVWYQGIGIIEFTDGTE